MEMLEPIFGGILVIATSIYVYFTYKLVQESRKTREIGLRPQMIMYLDYSETSPASRFLNIQNVGKGVAKNVRFKLLKDFNTTTSYDAKIESRGFIDREYNYFPPEYSIRHYIFNYKNDPEQKSKDSIEIECEYEDIFKEKIRETFKLKFKDGFAAGKLTPPDSYVGLISYRLEKMEKILEKINKNLTPPEEDF